MTAITLKELPWLKVMSELFKAALIALVTVWALTQFGPGHAQAGAGAPALETRVALLEQAHMNMTDELKGIKTELVDLNRFLRSR